MKHEFYYRGEINVYVTVQKKGGFVFVSQENSSFDLKGCLLVIKPVCEFVFRVFLSVVHFKQLYFMWAGHSNVFIPELNFKMKLKRCYVFK